jgi:hypothetical protein
MDQSKRIIEIAEAYIPTSDLMTLLYKRRIVAQEIKGILESPEKLREEDFSKLRQFDEIETALKAHLRLAQ